MDTSSRDAPPIKIVGTVEPTCTSMVARVAVAFGSWITGMRFFAPIDHWRPRIWDGYRAEEHTKLGTAYREQRRAVTEMLNRVVSPGAAVADIACGTGRYTFAALAGGAGSVTAFDVSAASLTELAKRSENDPRVRATLADIWDELPTGTVPNDGFDVVLCCDAIHHLGPLPDVVDRLFSLTRPGGYLIGDVWSRDNFHEFQRLRRGWVEHTVGSVLFAGAALASAVMGRPVSGAARSQIFRSDEIVVMLRNRVGPRVRIERGRYWVRFAARRGSDDA